ncbi:potassium channel subfamily K member 9-like [Actinia tenebrosa]|uniref:Potassium channel subfamily K member 9-like n=1 Tax=Actinia tenebrosa TaxID=6105 RepID=A0A6P8IK07_ACTTE|nr:potassium channel subfamily K member 9-like [Actinia tenebrosa]
MTEYSLKRKAFQRLVALTAYVLIWSAVFMIIEQTGEPNTVVANRMLEEVKNNISRLLGANISEEHFDALVNKISGAVKVRERPDWKYWKTVDFVIQSLTTIGFGDLTPRTLTGQMVFIFFAVIGLPFTMVTLKTTGELMHDVVKKLIIFFERRFLQKQETKNLHFKCVVFSFAAFIALHAYGAELYVTLNQTGYFEGIYASFVTLSTIGFGDYILDFRETISKNNVSDASMTALLLFNLPLLLINLTIVSCFLNSIMFMLEILRKRNSCISDCNTEGQENPVPVSSNTDQEMATKASF